MKRLLLVVIALLFASNLLAQSEVMIKFVTKDSNGREKQLYVSDSSGTSYGYFPVKIMGGSVTITGNFVPSATPIDSLIASRMLLQNQYTLSRYTYTKRGTSLTSAGDSLSIGSINTWGQIILESKGDTIEVAYNRSFTNSVIIYPNGQYTSTKEGVLSFPDNYIYLRGYGAGSSLPYQLILKGY